MADKSNSSRTTPRPYRVRGGHDFSFARFEESTAVSTATIKYGDVVGFDVNVATAAHRIVKSTASSNAIASTQFVGIAVETSTSDGSATGLKSSGVGVIGPNDKSILVCLATPNTEFLFPTKSSVVTSTCLGTRRALAYDSTLSMYFVDMANSSAGEASVVITEIPEPGNDANNPVVAKFISTSVSRLVSVAY